MGAVLRPPANTYATVAQPLNHFTTSLHILLAPAGSDHVGSEVQVPGVECSMPGAMAVAGCTAVTRPGPCLHHVMVSTPPVAGVRQPVRQQHCCHPQPHGHQSTTQQSQSHSHIIDTILTSSSNTDINTQNSERCSAHIPGHQTVNRRM